MCEVAAQCLALQLLDIGKDNMIKEAGAQAIAEYCQALTDLRIGSGNGIRYNGVKAIVEQCTALTTLNIGHSNALEEEVLVVILPIRDHLPSTLSDVYNIMYV